jgi:hypothetical protein
MVQIMITNGGPHPYTKWAVATAQQIIDIGANATGTQAMDARKLENKIIDILEVHHKCVQDDERDELKSKSHARLCEDILYDVTDYVDDPVSEIVAASVGTPFEHHFAQPQIQAYLREVIALHFRTSKHIERSWHADKHPHTEEAKTFRLRHNYHPDDITPEQRLALTTEVEIK